MSVSFVKLKLLQWFAKPGVYVVLLSIMLLPFDKQSILVGSLLYSLMVLNRWMNIKEDKAKIEAFDKETPSLVDKMMLDALERYIILTIGPDIKYITEKDEDKMRRTVLDIFLHRLSEPMEYKLRSYFRKEFVEDELIDRLNIVITSYVIENNRIKDDGKDLMLEDPDTITNLFKDGNFI